MSVDAIEPVEKFIVTISVVLVANKAGFFAAFNIGRQIININRSLWCELILLDGQLVNFLLRFDVTCLVGKNTACKTLKNRVLFL